MSLYSRGRTRRSLIDTVAFRAVSQAASILGYIVLVRGMSKEDFGAFNLLYAFIPVISTLASLGLEQTLRRYQPEYLRAGNPIAAAWLVRFATAARFGANVLLLGIILLAWNYAAPLFKLEHYKAEFAVFCVLALLYFQSRILQMSLAAHMLHRYSVGSLALLSVLKLAVYGFLSWRNAFTLENAILGETIMFGIIYVLLSFAYRWHCRRGVEIGDYRPDAIERKRLFRYAFFNNFNDAGTLMLTTKTDNFFIAALIDTVSVGIYSFYTRLTLMGTHLLPVKLFENVIQPVFFSLPPEHADRKVPQYFSLLLNLNLVLQWPMLAYVTAYHAEIVRVIFGDKFVEQSWLLPLMVGFATLNVVTAPVTLVTQYDEKAKVLLISKVFGIYNVVALLVLLPIAGVYGAAIASGTAQMMKNGFVWWHSRRRARWLNAASAVFSGLLLWVAVVVICRWLASWAPELAIVNMAVGVLVVSGALLLHVRGPALSTEDRSTLAIVFRGREARLLRLLGLLKPRDIKADRTR